MDFSYEILFTISFRHNYYNSNAYRKFKVMIPPETAQIIDNHGLVCKIYEDRVIILFDAIFCNTKRTREDVLKTALELTFTLKQDDPYFFNYTDVEVENISAGLFIFKNYKNTTAEQRALLHNETFVSAKDFVILPERNTGSSYPIPKDERESVLPIEKAVEDLFYFSKYFGKINITFEPELENELSINFNSQSTFWRYILASAYLVRVSHPSIINKETKESFDGPIEIILPDKKKTICFQSKQTIKLSETGNRSFQLVENYQQPDSKQKIVIPVLSNPSIDTISKFINTTVDNSKKNISNIII